MLYLIKEVLDMSVRMRGWIINTEDLTEKLLDTLAENGINELGIHPGGGRAAGRLLDETARVWETEKYRALLKKARALGIKAELEAHVLSRLLPRELFGAHPDWFRADETGTRVNDFNLCVSSEEALACVSDRAYETAKRFATDSHRYAFWPDDVNGYFCKCPACRELSVSDQALLITNAILRGVRHFDPQGIVGYLAYYETMSVPTRVKPLPGVYLEYAPIDRDSSKPIYAPENAHCAAGIRPLLDFFGTENARVLEYWVDNSRFSDWKRPPKPMTLNEDVMRRDVEYYTSLGFIDMTSFACFLGEDYRALYGEPPIPRYAGILRERK